ncbi:MAG: efflux RND transporter permease subunit [Gammaproteobacteria bacterium]|nr:efflux RND transporter permease subunit [Gammaproteobacteria bacterium]
MNIAEYTIKNKVLSVIVIFLAILGGWSAYKNMPRFEDPEFTIRQAQVITQYPGASPMEVAEEVTDPLERAIQQLQEVETVKSVSSPGVSEITVEIKYEFSKTKSDLQIIWTKLRNKVSDAERNLPPGAGSPFVADDFGDVYGLYYFITGEGYTPAELRRYAKDLQSELLLVDGVAKVSIDGELQEVIYVEISRENAVTLGVSLSNIYNILAQQNAVVAAGDVIVGEQRIVIDPSGEIDSVDAIQNLLVSAAADGRIIYLKDIARVWRGYESPPKKLFRYNGQPAIAIGVSAVLGGNIVKIGQAVDEKIAESESRRPLGIELHEYYHQGKVVDVSVQDFLLNVIAALVIVIVTLFIFMGVKSATVIGAILLLTIFATLATMNIMGIPMHRISLGALIIALGMMVDNAIVVTEGILVGVQRGRKKLDIAKEIVEQTKWPLLGGTIVGIIAFAPIGFAPGDTAEYTGHLFWVVLISLLFSWVWAVTLTPLFCYWLFKEPAALPTDSETEQHAILSLYKKLLQRALGKRTAVVSGAVGLFLISLWGFQFVKDGFFPASTTPQIVIDYWLPQGTDIARTARDIEEVENFVSQLEGVNAVQTSIGAGGIRYMLVYGPESPNSAYAQILAKVDDYKKIDRLMPLIQDFIDQNYPNAQSKVWRFILGPGGGSKIEATFKGSDPTVLRQLADEAKAVMIADGGALSVKDNWRQQVSVIEPIYSESAGRRAGISREDIALALQTNFSGRSVGVYREGDDLLPIVSRAPVAERLEVTNINNIQVLSSTTGRTVPIEQVTDGFRTIWRNGQVRREDRIWTIKAQSDPYPDELASELLARIRPSIEAIVLPDGYTLEWDGEYGDSTESQEDLATTLPLGFLAMVLTVFILFGAVRQPVVIWLVVPLALIGVVVGLVTTQLPLEFMAILGVLSLSGLLIKNAIVLVDQTDFEIKTGKLRFDAVIDAATSRVRPVMMGALTTVLGVIPLFFDAFFKSMSVVLVFGLSFATVLTLVIVPVLYTIFFNISPEESQVQSS